MEDEQCPVCKTELDEIVISSDMALTYDRFERKLRSKKTTI